MRENENYLKGMLFGGASGTISNILTQPFDVIKTYSKNNIKTKNRKKQT
jgi:hypothetical protein